MTCIRTREQELMLKLENIVAVKEKKLSEQQKQLNQAIGKIFVFLIFYVIQFKIFTWYF